VVEMRDENRYAWQPRRLLEGADVVPESPAAWALELLRNAKPYKPVAGQKPRVRLGLGRIRHAPLLLRPALVLGLLLGGGAFASAALGDWPGLRNVIGRTYDRVIGSDAPAGVEPRAGTRHVDRSGRRPDPPAPAAGDSPAPIVPPGPAREPASRRIRRQASPQAVVREDTSPVVEAMRALRVERDSARARTLLTSYLTRHPNGTLAEEATAMRIEAAVAHGDADVRALAAGYLKRYPSGPFKAVAQRALRANQEKNLKNL
jgi:hypothetical protein